MFKQLFAKTSFSRKRAAVPSGTVRVKSAFAKQLPLTCCVDYERVFEDVPAQDVHVPETPFYVRDKTASGIIVIGITYAHMAVIRKIEQFQKFFYCHTPDLLDLMHSFITYVPESHRTRNQSKRSWRAYISRS